jgi:hypothetical protein
MPALEPLVGDVVLEAERLEEILIDDVGPGADDGVDHLVADHVDEHLLEAGADQRAGEADDHAAVGVAEHPVVDVGRPGQVAGRKGERLHRLDQRHHVVLLDVDVLDRLLQKFLLRWFPVGHGLRLLAIFSRVGRLRENERTAAGFERAAADGKTPETSPLKREL